MHAGRKSQFCSFAGSIPGRRLCAWLTPTTKKKTRRTSTATTMHAAVAASERAMKMSGTRKKQTARYASANQRYLAVVLPMNLAALIGIGRSGQMTYHTMMPDRLKKRCE